MRTWLLPLTVLLVLAAGGSGAAAATGGDPARPRGVWPLDPRPTVSSGFDPPDSRWGAGHRGVDLFGSAGQTVRAALPGTVTFASTLAGRGVLVVDHGGTRTTYQPVVATVDVGDAVDVGDPIGRLVLRGSHCLPVTCLHWGWLRGETYLDPLDLVGTERVRLLPPDGLPVPTVPLATRQPLGDGPPDRAPPVPGLGHLFGLGHLLGVGAGSLE